MPTVNINKFFGLHDGIPEQPGFASKCDNLWITEHGKLSKRGGIQPLPGSALPGSALGSTAAIFTMEAPKAHWVSDTDFGQLNIRSLFVLEGTGKLWVRAPSGSWSLVQAIPGYNLPASSQITSANIQVMNDIALLSWTVKSGLTSTHENYSSILFARSFSPYPWHLEPAFNADRAFTDNLGNEGKVENTGGGANPRIVAYAMVSGITTHKDNEYEVVGRPTYGQVTDATFKVYIPAAIASDYENGMTSTMYCYLTQTNGTTLYRYPPQDVSTGGSVTKTFIAGDVISDTSVPIIYTQAGEIDNNEFRLMSNISCKTSNNIFWCLDEESGRVRQSKPSQPYAWPGSFETSFSDRVVGMASIERYPIVFTDNGCYRIEGFLDASGNGSSRVMTISETVGTFNHDSIVSIGKEIYFLSVDGVYMTNGFNVVKVSDHLNKTYARLCNRIDNFSLSGAQSSGYDRVNKMIFWTLKDPSAEASTLVAYPEIKHEGGIAFTTMNSQELLDSAALGYVDNMVILAKTPVDGVFYLPTVTKEIDPSNSVTYLYDKLESASGGDPQVVSDIIYDFLSTPISFGSKTARKWVSRVFFTLNKLTQPFNASFGVYGVNDHTGEHSLTQIRFLNMSRILPVIKRHFPRSFLRCTHKQIGIRAENIVITSSNEYGVGTLTGDTVVVAGGNFPLNEDSNFEGYYIQFSHQNYSQDWPIKSNNVNTIRLFSNPTDDALDIEWKVRGIPKDENLLIDDIGLEFTPIGEGHIDYTPERGGDIG